MKSLRASDLDAVLLASPKGIPIKAQASQVNEMTINTIIAPRFRSPVKIHNRIWFNPTNAAAIGRIRIRRGEDDFKKNYRFTDQGVFRHRVEPENENQARLAPEKWTDIKDTFYPYEPEQLGCSVVSERTVLVYILSTVALSNSNAPLNVCVFGKRQLHRVNLRNAGSESIKVNFIEKSRQNEIRKQGTIKAIKVAITAQPIHPVLEDAENFSFLGFHKDISVYIEPSSGLPVEAGGILPTIGRAQLKLRECQMRK
jgi:hypothetical protein